MLSTPSDGTRIFRSLLLLNSFSATSSQIYNGHQLMVITKYDMVIKINFNQSFGSMHYDWRLLGGG